ncbi:hypothetical protein JXO59_14705, partial [candidate division KSB1 bacterium]|nr:hypothetical protein [candidate division KSB1 bacterium]
MYKKTLVVIFLGMLVNILNAQLLIKNSSEIELMRVTNSGLVGIRTNTPTADLDVNGTVRIRGGSPAAGKVLMATDSNGNAGWQNISATDELVEDQILIVNSASVNDQITITDGNGNPLNTITIDDDYEANTDNQNLGYINDNAPTGNYVTHRLTISGGSGTTIRDYYDPNTD